MPFYATDFIFDGIPSEEYGLIISSDSGESSNEASHNVELITDEIYRRHTPYFYGVKQSQMLRLPGSIRSVNGEITAEDSAYIQSWLFGQMTFKELRVIQPDMENYYFKCFLLDPEIVRVGNIIVGYDFTIQLDSPFAYGEEKIFVFPTPTYEGGVILNNSDNNYYTYPKMTIEASDTPTDPNVVYARILNQSDNNRAFQIGGIDDNALNASEYILIDSDLQTIISYQDSTMSALTTDNRISVLENGYFFRLVPGVNNLIFDCPSIYNITISYTPLKRIA